MKNRSILFFIIMLTGFLFSGCKKEKTLPPLDMGHSYFPLAKDLKWIYQVDSIVIDDFTGNTDTFQFLLKDSIVSVITDQGTDTVYQIEQYKKISDSTAWTYQKNYTLTRTHTRAEVNDENIRYVRMTFPVTEHATWNGNAFNSLGEQIYQYNNIAIYILPDETKVPAITVIQQNNINLIREEYASETYGKDFGLIKKEIRMIDKDIQTQEITSGYIYIQLIAY
jgi:hypothetical protein